MKHNNIASLDRSDLRYSDRVTKHVNGDLQQRMYTNVCVDTHRLHSISTSRARVYTDTKDRSRGSATDDQSTISRDKTWNQHSFISLHRNVLI